MLTCWRFEKFLIKYYWLNLRGIYHSNCRKLFYKLCEKWTNSLVLVVSPDKDWFVFVSLPMSTPPQLSSPTVHGSVSLKSVNLGYLSVDVLIIHTENSSGRISLHLQSCSVTIASWPHSSSQSTLYTPQLVLDDVVLSDSSVKYQKCLIGHVNDNSQIESLYQVVCVWYCLHRLLIQLYLLHYVSY